MTATPLGRRAFIGGLSAIALPSFASATPTASPSASPIAGTRAKTRADYERDLFAAHSIETSTARGGTVVFGHTNDIQTLNPIVSADSYSGLIIRLMFNYLVRPGALDGLPAPDLADSWTASDDNTVYTFSLNPNATWHDGTPVTAADAVFSFETTLQDDSPSPRKWTVADVVKSFRAIDPHTFEVTTVKPIANAVSVMGLVGIVPKHLWSGLTSDQWYTDGGVIGTDPSRVIGSGPFRFKEWVTGDHVSLVRNDAYWNPGFMPTMDTFVYQVIGESTSLSQALISGDIDLSVVDFADAESLRGNADITQTIVDTNSVNWIDMMLDPDKVPFFTDTRVRQAMMHALDRHLLATTIYRGYAEPARGFLPPLHQAYDPDDQTTPFELNVEKAKTLLAAAGWVDSDGDGIVEKDGTPFIFECHYAKGSGVYDEQIPYLKQAWKRIGIEMNPAPVPFSTLTELGKAGKYQMRIRGYTWNVDAGFGTVFNSRAIKTGFNSMHYSNPAFDALDDRQIGEMDPAVRNETLRESAEVLWNDVAGGVLVYRKQAYAARNTLHNMLPTGHDPYWSLPFLWSDRR